jgi:hypothetical protein
LLPELLPGRVRSFRECEASSHGRWARPSGQPPPLVRRAGLIAFAVIAAVVVLPIVAMLAFYAIPSLGGGCSESEIRVFREFPQYGGRRLEPEYSSEGCFVTFTTEDEPERVLRYYRQQLTAHGWKLDRPPPPVEAAPGQPGEPGGLGAARGRYGYQALFESTRGGTSVVIYVIDREK